MGLFSSVVSNYNAGNSIKKSPAPVRENVISTMYATNPYTQNRIEIVYVSSSNVVGASYDPKTLTLMVEFRRYVKGQGAIAGGGPRYEYAGVSPIAWNTFKSTGSKGKWVWAVLRRRGVPYRRIR